MRRSGLLFRTVNMLAVSIGNVERKLTGKSALISPYRFFARLVLLLGAVELSFGFATALAQETELIAGGELEYQNYCAVCHGVDGKGLGIMSKFLTVRPADLTQLSNKNGGTFPFWSVYRVIEGRAEVRGHGTREMPIWGDRFLAQAGGSDPGARAQAAGRLLGLVFYLQYIQQQ